MQTLRVNGPAIRRTRELAGLSVVELVQRMSKAGMNVHPAYLRQLERGDRQPSAPCFKVIVRALGCTKEDLLDLEPAA